ncbi:hypothetical protein [Chitinophaga ginsengisoli]|uniref:Uncharacterized protein n=1 Tax=Chitinophaga ginsengisoli TaxID=363837 RepID=A0A2P8FZE1_9BACT|nr:hypothetical protein [Chitinophaga ginsengisoli]PSL27084.1 hypothetical protein CLV42_110238 [Chitinophaga ginsengisoli]
MKKKTEKKLDLGKIKIGSLNRAKQDMNNGLVAAPTTTILSFKVCTDDISQGAPICSVDSCRF